MLRRIHPVIVLDAVVTLAVLIAAQVAPESFLQLRAQREGPLEHVSHVVLLAALGAWGLAARSLRRPSRGIALAIAAYLLLLLLEEIDWGLVYGIDIGFEHLFGVPSFHQTTWKNEHVWQDKLYWFGAPVAAWFSAAWLWEGLRRYAPAAPTRADSAAFLSILLTFLVVDQLHPHVIGIYQTVMYALFAWIGWRASATTAGTRHDGGHPR
ncbi:MAG: hypothetical protein R3B13_18175 [Polyangiaceae bacterium]